eukprot:CAMPEP_0198430466 /NCGR_PEP_ID=MMETSP1452-20131203/13587_1 /TAXON_ID=1181717 /ORGANISM="Synchroma pusillum, Strain CCMP3072" /LENGTH=299 /DNA_ID=CAMNT_0044150905 /DNA_START=14 /DNA_END=909 /DNA_ORIENTATION=+
MALGWGRAGSRALSTTTNITKVGVCGLGLMGHGIAQLSAAAGYQVVALDPSPAALDAGRARIVASLRKTLEKKAAKDPSLQVAEEEAAIMGRLSFVNDMADLGDCDLVVEAIKEDLDLKKSFYQELGGIAKPECILASNTSSLPITAMGVASNRPELFLGVHFFNPVQLMKLVEVVRTDSTAPEVFDTCTAWVRSLGKTPVSCKDTPGFIVNRLLVPYLVQAILMVERGDATIPDVDVSMQLGAGHPMGPLHLADYVGLDTMLSIMEGWSAAHPSEATFVVPRLLAAKVASGHLGRKTG